MPIYCQHGQHLEMGGNISKTLMVICCGAKEPLVKSLTIMEVPNLTSLEQSTLINTIIILYSILWISCKTAQKPYSTVA